jgi:glycosyltransferase involved in cell wall biosynthesis
MNNSLQPESSPVAVWLRRAAVVIPALNEAGCVADTVRAWLRLGAARVRVVDNGSSDDTAALAAAAGAETLAEPQRGYGAAAWRGLQDWPADAEWVLFSSADGSDRLSPDEARAWQAAVDAGADLVIGDRTQLPESRAQLKAVQRLGNGITCLALRWGWGRRFRDMGSLRLARHRALMELGLKDRGFGWNVEMQVRAMEQGWNIVELPVRYHPRASGESKISGNLAGTLRAGWAILRMLALLWRLRRASVGNATAMAAARSAR